jgi:hypothetical protein
MAVMGEIHSMHFGEKKESYTEIGWKRNRICRPRLRWEVNIKWIKRNRM